MKKTYNLREVHNYWGNLGTLANSFLKISSIKDDNQYTSFLLISANCLQTSHLLGMQIVSVVHMLMFAQVSGDLSHLCVELDVDVLLLTK